MLTENQKAALERDREARAALESLPIDVAHDRSVSEANKRNADREAKALRRPGGYEGASRALKSGGIAIGDGARRILPKHPSA
jgi:hypothetical protein